MSGERATLREWFDSFQEAVGEPVEFVVLGESGWDGYAVDVAMPWEEVPSEVLDRSFDCGFGGSASPNVCAWSESWVMFSDVYDGFETACWVPRSPMDHAPIRPGGE